MENQHSGTCQQELAARMRQLIQENAAVLVRIPNWIGDAVMSTAGLNAIRHFRPDLKLTALVKPWVREVIRNHPAISDTISYNPHRMPARVFDFFRAAKEIRKRSFSVYTLFHSNPESALMGYVAGIPIRIGVPAGRTRFLLTHRVDRSSAFSTGHQVQRYLAVAEMVTGSASTGFQPEIFLTDHDRKEAAVWLAGIPGKGPVITVAAGAAYGSAKCWPPELFTQFFAEAVHRWNARIIVLGGKNDRHIYDRILTAGAVPVFSMVGEHSLSVQAAVMEQAGICVTNDSGLMHVSAALSGVTTIAIFGPTVPAATGPYGPEHIVLHSPVACWPCKHRECPTDHACMFAVSVNNVIGAVETALRKR